ncbi:CNH domain-containing protein [Flagelloscypha sp. PMI_526]|nr:CNH domain-containing protein [Flagelloscypha sp. PMI_526]
MHRRLTSSISRALAKPPSFTVTLPGALTVGFDNPKDWARIQRTPASTPLPIWTDFFRTSLDEDILVCIIGSRIIFCQSRKGHFSPILPPIHVDVVITTDNFEFRSLDFECVTDHINRIRVHRPQPAIRQDMLDVLEARRSPRRFRISPFLPHKVFFAEPPVYALANETLLYVAFADGIYTYARNGKSVECRLLVKRTGILQFALLPDTILLLLDDQGNLESWRNMNPSSSSLPVKQEQVASGVTFFRTEQCANGQNLVCLVKSSRLTSSIRILEYQHGARHPFSVYRNLSMPTSIHSVHFSSASSKIFVATEKGFEVVNLETVQTASLLDPNDKTIAKGILTRNEHGKKPTPLLLHRLNEGSEFLLCYDEFAMYIDKLGAMTRDELVFWETPAVHIEPFDRYILVFNKLFVEVRNPQTGELIQCVRDVTRTSFSPIRLLNDERRGSGPVFFLNHGQVHMIEEELEDNGTIFQL